MKNVGRKAKLFNRSSSLFTLHCSFIPYGGVAQLGEHLPCKQGVMGSIPIISTRRQVAAAKLGVITPKSLNPTRWEESKGG